MARKISNHRAAFDFVRTEPYNVKQAIEAATHPVGKVKRKAFSKEISL